MIWLALPRLNCRPLLLAVCCLACREQVLQYAARLQAASAAAKQTPPENTLTCLAELFLQVCVGGNGVDWGAEGPGVTCDGCYQRHCRHHTDAHSHPHIITHTYAMTHVPTHPPTCPPCR